MADGFIVRKGGVAAEQTATPSILDFSTASATSIKFKLRNNDLVAATLVYRFGTLTGDGESISVAASTTTGEITLTVPTITAATSLFVTANATGKVKSEVAEQEFAVPVIYTAATGGTTLEYDSGGKRFKSHTFLSDGTFTVTTVGNGDLNKVDYLIIAGGGGGGAEDGGGGGAGGYLTTLGATAGDVTPKTKVVVTAQGYSIDVGSGGAASIWSSTGAGSGTNSSAFGETAIGGGRGSNEETPGPASGGSGGGGRGRASGSDSLAGAAGTSGQGFAGGDGKARSGGDNEAGGGGGGASAIGGNATGDGVPGTGGNGLANLLRTGSNETRAGGGGGGGKFVGTGGTGGGADGGSNAVNPTAATANTGSGGGGAGGNAIRNGTAGADGIVVIRYEIAPSV